MNENFCYEAIKWDGTTRTACNIQDVGVPSCENKVVCVPGSTLKILKMDFIYSTWHTVGICTLFATRYNCIVGRNFIYERTRYITVPPPSQGFFQRRKLKCLWGVRWTEGGLRSGHLLLRKSSYCGTGASPEPTVEHPWGHHLKKN
ncbi:uncharacterized protein LOC102450210 isoform X2 [Pelodiscus sinensis]|uniref:uncharacterized protein LOC102450210 isoform X2 n=1 Tax=Pelodiscus sinensis TaxID=13735 RepID=UPI003F6C7402